MLAQFALGIWYIISVVLVSGSPCSGCLGVAYEFENWILRETTFFVGAMLGTTVDTCSASVLWWLWKNLLLRFELLTCSTHVNSRPRGVKHNLVQVEL